MREKEFNVLFNKFKNGNASKEELEQLEEYKVDNAIIMAAGFGLRSLPLSRTVPKGLYKVRGEVLIERQIEQIKEAGISEIIVVVGYLKEKFEYLKKKYDVVIVENDDYYRYNNISSIYAAREYLKNSYICCSDNYFNKNVFEKYVYDSYYSCLYSKEYANEYCITKWDGDYIKEITKGGSNAWYTIGEAFFSKTFSETFMRFLEAEYDEADVKKMLWDDFHMRHIKDLPLRFYKYDHETVQEFDTVEDILEFDPGFEEFKTRELEDASKKKIVVPKAFDRYEDVTRYDSATTDQHTGRLHLNENTFGPSPKCLNVLRNVTINDLYEYDMSSKDFLINEISRSFSIPEDDIFIHNGSAELIKSVFSIALEKGDTVLVPDPGWSYYSSLAREKFCNVDTYEIKRDDYSYYVDYTDLFDKMKSLRPKLLVIVSPNNPTGCKIHASALEEIVRDNPDSLILFDEAYFGFDEEDIDIRRIVESYSNIIVSRTFSKFYGLADLRIGFAFCNFRAKPVWGLDLPLFRGSKIARRMAVEALCDKEYYKRMCLELNHSKQEFSDRLNMISGIRAFQSSSNFVPVQIVGVDMEGLRTYLKERGFLIRLFDDHGEKMARVAIADKDTMMKAAGMIEEYYQEKEK